MIFKHNILYFIFVALAACAFGGNKPGTSEKNTDKPYITDSVNRHGNIERSFGNDSVYVLSADSVLQAILYPDTLSAVSRILFEGGKKYYVEYNPQNTPDSLSSESFYADGALYSRFYAKDSVITDAGNSVGCNQYYEEYYPDGRIKMTGQQGFFGASGTSVGMHKEYDESGKLLTTKNFIYPPAALDETAAEYLTYVVECDYYDNGKPKWRKVYRNYVYYETDHPENDDDGQMRLGVWKYYNEQGDVKTEKYSRFNEKTGENKSYK